MASTSTAANVVAGPLSCSLDFCLRLQNTSEGGDWAHIPAHSINERPNKHQECQEQVMEGNVHAPQIHHQLPRGL